MKKYLTLFLLIAGMVSTASAAKLYINTAQNANWWTNVRVYAYNSDSDNNGWEYSETGVISSTETLFGKEWYVFDMGNYTNAIVQYFESNTHSISNQSSNITNITNDRFVFIPGTSTDGKWEFYENGYTFRCNVLNNWSASSCNMTVVDNNTLSYTLTKSEIESSNVDKIWFRILNSEGQIYPNADGTTLDYANGTSTYYNNWTETGWSYGINLPSFDYDKIVVTASLSGTTWTITADAYVSVTINNGLGFRTFSTNIPLDFSNVSGLTAYKGTVTNGVATFSPVTAIPENTGVLLKGADNTYQVPVAYNPAAVTGNELVGVTSETSINQTTDGKTNLVLMPYGAGGAAFYKVSSAGFTVGANTAYLSTATANLTASEAKGFLELNFDNDVTGIKAIDKQDNNYSAIYNLNGQYVGRNADILPRGLYVINGKKIMVK